MIDAPPRPDAPTREQFTLTIDDVILLYEGAEFPRPRRRIQKYCARGDLECLKVETESGEKYLITPASVERHIALIQKTDAARRGPPRPDAPERAQEQSHVLPEQGSAPTDAQARLFAADTRYVEHLEDENKFLRGQLNIKDDQIKQANILTQGLQRLIAGITGTPDPVGPREGSLNLSSHKDTSSAPADQL
jgi:hypothetical protein